MKNVNKRKYCVYLHTVPKEISGYDIDKRYVGITCKRNPEKRWENGFGYRYNTHFFNAIQKYGWNNILHEIIAKDLDFQSACDMEKLFIALYNTCNPRYGYNKTYGGEGTLGCKMSCEEKQRRSERFTGKNNPFYHKKHTDETRKKMSERHYDVRGGKNPKARKTFQFDIDFHFIRTFDTVALASQSINKVDMAIFNAIKKKKLCGGYFWAFDNEVVPVKDSYVVKDKSLYSIPHRGKYVKQFDLNDNYIATFPSAREAQKVTGIVNQNICKVARRGYGTAGGYKWRYF